MPSTTIDRATLYAQVWETPLSRLAPTYGITDVALKKACARLGVPTPPRGYWAKRQHGHDVPRPPLPPPAPGAPTTYAVTPTEPGDLPEPSARPDRPPLPPALDPTPTVEVPDALRRPDPLVRETRAALKGGHADEYGRLRTHKASLDLHVSKQSLHRALRIANALIRAARHVGFEVEVGGERSHARFLVEGEAVPFGIHEPSRKEIIPKKPDAPSWERDSVQYHPSGNLELRFGTSYSDYARTLRDTTSARLEQRLGLALVEVYRQAQRQREDRAQREAARREWERKQEEERRRAEERAVESARRQRLEEQAASWRRSQEVAAFVDAVEARAADRDLSDAERSDLDAWVRWAREHVARLDPLTDRLPHELPPPDAPRRLYL